MPESVSLSEAVQSGIDKALDHLHTATIGIVDGYNLATQRARIQSALRRPLLRANGEAVFEDFPSFDDIPVLWPRGSSGGLCGALAPGDSVLLVFLQYSAGEWRERGGTQNPADLRQHSDGYPVALAGIAPDAAPLLATLPDAWELGFFGTSLGRVSVRASDILLGRGATDFVALSSGLAFEFAAVVAKVNEIITAYNLHGHAAFNAPTASLVDGNLVVGTAYQSTMVKAL